MRPNVLNTFQANIRNFIKKSNKKIIFVQRLKRLSTIINKLHTRRASFPMNDIAGCRLIFENTNDIYDFRKLFHENRSKHELISVTKSDAHKYDYIKKPKRTGYRGIHDVYKYVPYAQSALPYKGLRIEIQYRTLLQHSWSTAVEILDAIDGTRVKFATADDGDGRSELFIIASEIVARKEGWVGCLPDSTPEKLESVFRNLEKNLGVIFKLRHLAKEKFNIKGKHVVLEFGNTLLVKKFRRASLAMRYRNIVELKNPGIDIVYVRLDDPAILYTAFKNYYRDAKDFIDIMPTV